MVVRDLVTSQAAAVVVRQIQHWQWRGIFERFDEFLTCPAVHDAVTEALQWRQAGL